MNRRSTGLVLAGLALLCAAGCTKNTASPAISSPKKSVTKATATAVSYPATLGTTESSAWTTIPYREYRTPGASYVEDFGKRVALLERSLAGSRSLWLLDFKTGKSKEVVHEALEAKKGFTVLGDRCSDGWLVWEEAKGDDIDSAKGVDWKVYAASIDEGSLSIGKPRLVTARDAVMEGRPLLSMDGDTLYAMTNGSRDAAGAVTSKGSRVRAFDLKARTGHVVYKSDRNMRCVAIEEGLLVVAENVDKTQGIEVKVVDPANGDVRSSIPLRNDDELAHYPAYHDGRLVWALISGERPDIYMRDANGKMTMLAMLSSDPVWVKDLLFFESHPRKSLGTGISAESSEIRVLDPATMKWFTLLSDDTDSRSWEAPIGTGNGGNVYVTFKTAPIDLAKGTAPTVVRRYELP